MDVLINFLVDHWLLSSGLIVLLITIIWVEINSQNYGITLLSVHDMVRLMNQQKPMIVDMRHESQYTKGHVLGALSIVQKAVEQLDKRLLNQSRPILLICEMGHQAAKVGAILKTAGCQEVYGLKGGMRAWHEAGLPVTQSKG